MATQRTRGGQFAAYLGPVLFIYLVFLIAPYLVLFRMSLNEFSSLKLYIPAFTFANYTTVLTEPYYLGLLARSFLIGILVSLVTLVMGLALAVYIASRGPLMKSLLMGAVLSPLLINLVVRTYAWLILLGDQGVINQWLMGWGITGSPLPINNNLFAVVIGLTHITLPLMVLSIVSVIETMPPNIIEAAESLGASRARVFRKVFIPQVMPGIAAGSLLVFCYTISAFITPQMLGGGRVSTLSTVIYEKFTFSLNWPVGSALVFVLLAANLAAMALHRRVFKS